MGSAAPSLNQSFGDQHFQDWEKEVSGRTQGRYGLPSNGCSTMTGEMTRKQTALKFTSFPGLPELALSSVTFFFFLTGQDTILCLQACLPRQQPAPSSSVPVLTAPPLGSQTEHTALTIYPGITVYTYKIHRLPPSPHPIFWPSHAACGNLTSPTNDGTCAPCSGSAVS